MTLHDEIRDIQTDLERLTGIGVRSTGLVDGPTLRAVRALILEVENARRASLDSQGPRTAENAVSAAGGHPGGPEG